MDCFFTRKIQANALIGESLCILPNVSFMKPMLEKIFTDFRYYECFFGLGVILFIALFGVYGPGYDAAAFIYAGISDNLIHKIQRNCIPD